MKTLVLACAAWMWGVVGVQADLTVVQTVEGDGQTLKLKAGKLRVDSAPGVSIIMDLQSGEMISLMHVPRTYLKVSGPAARAALEKMKSGQGGPGSTKPALTATGKTETISGFPADEYIGTVAGKKKTFWLTKAVPDYETALREMNSALKAGATGPLMQGEAIDLADLPGFPIRTVFDLPPGQTMTRTVISVNTQPVPDAEFEIPAGYKEMSVPVLTPPAAVAGPSPSPSR